MQYTNKRTWMDSGKEQNLGLLSQLKHGGYGQAMIMALLIFLLIISITVMVLYLFAYIILFWNLGLYAC